ncbi:MAG: hypothetical protein ACM3VS_13905 [Candidatus Dadabacteria bacterium]
MNKAIKTYEDLTQEEQRLKGQLESYKLLIKDDITGLKEALNPIKRGIGVAKRLFTRDNNGPVLNFGLNFGLDMLLRKILLARAGWMVKFLIPYIVKNYASHIIAEEDRGKIVNAVAKLFAKFKIKKPQQAAEAVVANS